MRRQQRAIVVGSGPNGLCAAIALAQAGVHATVYEAADTPGGCVRSDALTLPGFVHDVGAAVFPLGLASPFLRSLPLAEHGLEWIHPTIPLAHPLPGGDAVALHHDLDVTCDGLAADGDAWRRLVGPLAAHTDELLPDILAPAVQVPQHPLHLARFGAFALQSATSLAAKVFRLERTQTLFAGLAAHSGVPLNYASTSAAALVLAMTAHAGGWPIPRGGAQAITDALTSLLRAMGGEVVTGHRITSLRALPPADAVLLDIAPQQLPALAEGSLSSYDTDRYSNIQRGPGVLKMDWALSAPIPWTNDTCRSAGTIHLGDSLSGIAGGEEAVWKGQAAESPFIILAQPSLFDRSRAPDGQHTAWAYCHVPNGSSSDAFAAEIEAAIERHAPGFGGTILDRSVMTAAAMASWNENLVGGDISGGAMTLPQIVNRLRYQTPLERVFLCSSATAPGGGAHGMCGYHAARAAARSMGLRLRA